MPIEEGVAYFVKAGGAGHQNNGAGGDEEGAAKIAKPSSLSSAPSLGGKPSIAAVPGGAEGTSSHEAAEGGNGEG